MSQPSAADASQPDNASTGKRPAATDETRLIWVDMEMTGLRPEIDRIIEVAFVVTDSQLDVLAQSEAIAIRQPDSVLEAMDEWNRSTHGRSGLIDRVRSSPMTEASAERALIEFARQWVPPGKSPMCGNSVCQDRRFMARYMPALENYFHYRNLDVSTVKELCKRWQPSIARQFNKRAAHTALADIMESIEELRFYRERFIGAAPTA
jgi:oligoribonuclease